MKITLDYGKTGLVVDLPEETLVGPLEIRPCQPLVEPETAISKCLENPINALPLSQLAKGKKSACILICDITRPVPNSLILPPILETLENAGIPRDKILILVATGLHRPNEGAELEELVGSTVFRSYRIENHNGKDPQAHAYLGNSPRGVPIWIDRRYLEADLKIATGLIEPHFMAGYSGGRKLICPGIAGLETIKVWHGPRFIADPRADTGVLEGNPIHEENTQIAKTAGCDFIVNVCIDGQRRVTWVGAGDMVDAWMEGVRFVDQVVRVGVNQPLDIVVTSAAGYPLDTTWYQAIKGLIGAMPIVKKGGTVILAASLSEGLGSPEFVKILKDNPTMEGFKKRIFETNYFAMDQWQFQELAKFLDHCQVIVVTDGLSHELLHPWHVDTAPTVEAAVERCRNRYGPQAKIGVIPKGPYVLTHLQGA